jgi:hypothetical protein
MLLYVESQPCTGDTAGIAERCRQQVRGMLQHVVLTPRGSSWLCVDSQPCTGDTAGITERSGSQVRMQLQRNRAMQSQDVHLQVGLWTDARDVRI